MHSQHFAFTDRVPVAYLCNRSIETFGLKTGKKALLSSKTGSLKVRVTADDGVHPDTVVVFQGWWNKSGSVNVLTEIRVSDMGNNAAYNECFCRISGVDA